MFNKGKNLSPHVAILVFIHVPWSEDEFVVVLDSFSTSPCISNPSWHWNIKCSISLGASFSPVDFLISSPTYEVICGEVHLTTASIASW